MQWRWREQRNPGDHRRRGQHPRRGDHRRRGQNYRRRGWDYRRGDHRRRGKRMEKKRKRNDDYFPQKKKCPAVHGCDHREMWCKPCIQSKKCTKYI